MPFTDIGRFMLRSTQQNLLTIALVLSCGLGCDQATKRIAEQTLDGKSFSFLFDTFRLQFIKNSGAFLGFGAQFPDEVKFFLFLIIPIILLIGALGFVAFARSVSFNQRILITLMISGGLGNLVDRILLDGQVTDFMNMGIGGLRTGIFNVADVAITGGAIGLVILEVLKTLKEKIRDRAKRA